MDTPAGAGFRRSRRDRLFDGRLSYLRVHTVKLHDRFLSVGTTTDIILR